nr:MAG TPA: hypothetical protein [Caudoviricetes sp.]
MFSTQPNARLNMSLSRQERGSVEKRWGNFLN